MDVANDGTLIFASRGQCDGGSRAKVRASSNGGERITTPKPGLKEILAVEAGSGGDISVVVATTKCEMQQRTRLGPAKWSSARHHRHVVSGARQSGKVVSPSGSSKPGCTVISLSQVGKDFARVACSDGQIRGTGSGGDDWVALGRSSNNVRDLAFATSLEGIRTCPVPGCAAQTFITEDSGKSWKPCRTHHRRASASDRFE